FHLLFSLSPSPFHRKAPKRQSLGLFSHPWRISSSSFIFPLLSNSHEFERFSRRRFWSLKATLRCSVQQPLLFLRRRHHHARFACLRSNSDDDSDCDEFLEEFLRFLVVGYVAANRNARLLRFLIIPDSGR
ncbi:unnamed protein product, partial [Arabidopsis halleri]